METNANRDYILPHDVTEQTFAKAMHANNLLGPNSDYFEGMRDDMVRILGDYYDSVTVCDYNEFKSGLYGLAEKCELPVVSMDNTYLSPGESNCVGLIELTRAYDPTLTTFLGTVPRIGTPSIQSQIDTVAARCHSIGYSDVAILDDVLWSGSTIIELDTMFNGRGINIRKVLTGLEVVKGKNSMDQKGIEVNAVNTLNRKPESAFCQKDLLFGYPGSGNFVYSQTGEIYALPYFSPFSGKLQEDIDDELFNASNHFLEMSINFWSTIQNKMGEEVSLGLVNKIRPTPLTRAFPLEMSVVRVLKSLRPAEPINMI